MVIRSLEITTDDPSLRLPALKGFDLQRLKNSNWLAGPAVLGIVLLGYYIVYLTTPWILEDHLRSSLDRLLIQLWPSFLLVVSLMARDGDAG